MKRFTSESDSPQMQDFLNYMLTQPPVEEGNDFPGQSTGPKTPEGKQRSAMNSFKHGFTAQRIVICSEDSAAYKAHLTAFMSEHKPSGPTETFLVETLSDISWTVSRIRAQEQNYMCIVGQNNPLVWGARSENINVALGQASNLKVDLGHIDLLGRYEQRKMRLFRETLRDLLALQSNRKPERETAMDLLTEAPIATTDEPTANEPTISEATPKSPATHFVCPAPKTMTAQAPLADSEVSHATPRSVA